MKKNSLPSAPASEGTQERFLTTTEVMLKLAEKGIAILDRTTLNRHEAAGIFPMRIHLGKGKFSRVVWSSTEIDQWIAEKMQNRPAHRWRPQSEREAAEK